MKRSENILIKLSLFTLILFTIWMLPLTVTAADLPGKGISVQPIGTSSPDAQMQHRMVMFGLERLGYTVKPYKDATSAAIHVAVAQGDADFTAMHWNPLFESFYQKAGGDKTLWRHGAIIEGCFQGYLIDKKTAEKYNIKNLEQFKDPKISSLFDIDGDGKANLTGCNPGWGCERVIEHQLDAYDLRKWIEHDQGAYFALIADTLARFNQGKPIFYYTWTPMWVNTELRPGIESKWLQVPFSSHPDGENINTELPDGRNLGFPVNKMQVMANRKFIEANPAAKKFFELVTIPIEDINAESLLIKKGEKNEEDFQRHAREWIKKNQAQFDSWIEQALQAAK